MLLGLVCGWLVWCGLRLVVVVVVCVVCYGRFDVVSSVVVMNWC